MQVEVDDRAPALGPHLGRRRRELAAGVVHQPVEPPVPRDHIREDLVDQLGIADVEGDHVGHRTTCLGDLRGSRRQRLLSAGGQDDRRAQRRQLVRGAAPDAGPASGDEHHLIVEEPGAEDRPVRASRCHPLSLARLACGCKRTLPRSNVTPR